MSQAATWLRLFLALAAATISFCAQCLQLLGSEKENGPIVMRCGSPSSLFPALDDKASHLLSRAFHVPGSGQNV